MERHSNERILVLNSGSSSLKFTLFQAGETLRPVLSGRFERIGLPEAEMTFTDAVTGKSENRKVTLANHAACIPLLQDLLGAVAASVKAIAYRIVHGGPKHIAPELVTPEMVAEFRRIVAFAPEHLPAAIELIELFTQHYPGVPQVACFDTAFHAEMPRVAKLLPLPRRFDAQGVHRYGFHGLSYSFLMEELGRIDAVAAKGRVVLAHLGNGASMAAVSGGKSLDTTMGFTPAAGLVMSTRTGDLDPGVAAYLAKTENMSMPQFYEMVNKRSGLLGISETSSDTRDLLKREGSDVRAAEALALFCQQAKKWIGALVAVLNGLDTLVFSGGIGENSVALRARICTGMDCFGIELDAARNEASEAIISAPASKVTVRVMRTNEELYIAQAACRVVDITG